MRSSKLHIFAGFLFLFGIHNASASEITVNVKGVASSVESATPKGGAIPEDITSIIQAGNIVEARYTYSLPAQDSSDDPDVGFFTDAIIDFRVDIKDDETYLYSWSSSGAGVKVDNIGRLDRLIISPGEPIAPVAGAPVFGNTISYQLVYGEPCVGEFLGENTDIPASGFLWLAGSIVVQ